MASPALVQTTSLLTAGGSPRPRPSRRLRLRARAGAWHLSEDGDGLGGIFTSLSAAVAFVHCELRGVRGAYLVLELDGGASDGAA
jgi:hypothetical protein